MEKKQKVLIVEDEKNIVDILRFNLRKEGYDTLEAFDGVTGLRLALEESPDLILLDLMLPEMNGFEVCKLLRDKGKNTPVLIITAREEEKDKILGLDLGADDYITKPFDTKELVARVKAVLRRTQGPEEEKTDTLSFPGLTVSLSQYECHYEGKLIEMPPKELEVLYFLASHANQVFTREQLLEQVWGFDFFGDSRTVDVHIKRLREKLPECEKYGWMIRTVWGVGYKFEVRA